VIRVTLDSNIYISGLVFNGTPERLLQMAAEGGIDVEARHFHRNH
jgi:predicted nucleic acid-binding protein